MRQFSIAKLIQVNVVIHSVAFVGNQTNSVARKPLLTVPSMAISEIY